MKTKLLIIIAVVIFSSYIFFSLYLTNENTPYTRPSLNCGEKYIQSGNICQLNPTFIEKNTIIIYDVTDNSRTRMIVTPYSLVINLEENDTVTWINEGIFTVSVRDFTKEQYGIEYAKNAINKDQHSWNTGEFSPELQKSIQFNNTGLYSYRVTATSATESGEIVVLSKETNSLPVDIKAKMAQAIIGMDVNKSNIGVVSVGSGRADPGIYVGINEKFQDKYEDSLSYYYEYFDNLIPFDVPMTIEFQAPITFG